MPRLLICPDRDRLYDCLVRRESEVSNTRHVVSLVMQLSQSGLAGSIWLPVNDTDVMVDGNGLCLTQAAPSRLTWYPSKEYRVSSDLNL